MLKGWSGGNQLWYHVLYTALHGFAGIKITVTPPCSKHVTVRRVCCTLSVRSLHLLFQLTNNGQFVRMIPSLSGGIYRFNGSSIEPIPVTADLLLKSAPFTFSSDLAISG
jgi:hypothetical protein